METECPAGTKCVSDHFCDENALMVFTRVDLTPEQKKRRGDLIVSQCEVRIWTVLFQVGIHIGRSHSIKRGLFQVSSIFNEKLLKWDVLRNVLYGLPEMQ